MLSLHRPVAQPWMCDVMGHMTTRFYVAMFDDASYRLLYELFGWTGETGVREGRGWADDLLEMRERANRHLLPADETA